MVVLAINSVEGPDVVKKIKADNGLSLKILMDGEGAVGELYGIGVLPLTVFINKSGLKVGAVTGPLTLKEIEDEIAKLH